MRSPHPLLHMGFLPLCSNDTRSGEGFGYLLLLPFPTGQSKSVIHSLTLTALGSFGFEPPGQRFAGGIRKIKRRNIHENNNQ